MANMSYCRFENTRKDLDDCLDALREGNINSQRERDEAYRLLTSILDFCLENDVINDYDIYVVKELIEANPDED